MKFLGLVSKLKTFSIYWIFNFVQFFEFSIIRNFLRFNFFSFDFFRAREETSVPEDGECSDTYQKSKYQPRKRSASSSSRTSRSSSRSRSKKKKKVPKQYKDSSRSSSSESRIHHPVRPSGGGSRRSPSPLPGKRKVYIDKSPKKNKDDLFGQTYIPPQGFCDECNER